MQHIFGNLRQPEGVIVFPVTGDGLDFCKGDPVDLLQRRVQNGLGLRRMLAAEFHIHHSSHGLCFLLGQNDVHFFLFIGISTAIEHQGTFGSNAEHPVIVVRSFSQCLAGGKVLKIALAIFVAAGQGNVQIDTFAGPKIGNTERLVKFRQLARQFIGEQEILIREQTFQFQVRLQSVKGFFCVGHADVPDTPLFIRLTPAIQFKGFDFCQFYTSIPCSGSSSALCSNAVSSSAIR